MLLILTASKDANITNKIVDGSYRGTDANTGHAGTLDIFKLYDESSIDGESEPIELSRALLKFDYQKIKDLTGSVIDLNSSNFKCELVLKDVSAGQITPRDFNLILFPLSKSFDEGIGKDVTLFSDLDNVNFLTASGIPLSTTVEPINQSSKEKNGWSMHLITKSFLL